MFEMQNKKELGTEDGKTEIDMHRDTTHLKKSAELTYLWRNVKNIKIISCLNHDEPNEDPKKESKRQE